MTPSDEDKNRVHLYYIVREYCSNIEMGDIVMINNARIHHKASQRKANGERAYTYVVRHTDGWRVHIRVRATADSYSARIDRQCPDEDIHTYIAVNEWMASVCS